MTATTIFIQHISAIGIPAWGGGAEVKRATPPKYTVVPQKMVRP